MIAPSWPALAAAFPVSTGMFTFSNTRIALLLIKIGCIQKRRPRSLACSIPPQFNRFIAFDLALENFKAVVVAAEVNAFDELRQLRVELLARFFHHLDHFVHTARTLVDEVGAEFVEITNKGVHILRQRLEFDFDCVVFGAGNFELAQRLPLSQSIDNGFVIHIEVGSTGAGIAYDCEWIAFSFRWHGLSPLESDEGQRKLSELSVKPKPGFLG